MTGRPAADWAAYVLIGDGAVRLEDSAPGAAAGAPRVALWIVLLIVSTLALGVAVHFLWSPDHRAG